MADLTLTMEGGPDDGLVIEEPAGHGPEPPEELVSAVDPLGGRYVREPEPIKDGAWVYRWVQEARRQG